MASTQDIDKREAESVQMIEKSRGNSYCITGSFPGVEAVHFQNDALDSMAPRKLRETLRFCPPEDSKRLTVTHTRFP